MKIRSITYFMDAGWPLFMPDFEKARRFIQAASERFRAAGYEVQTTRLATSSFARLTPQFNPDLVVQFAQHLELMAEEAGIAYTAIGPALVEVPESYAVIPQVLAETKNVFASGNLIGPQGISLPALRQCAAVISQATHITPDGFTNLRFAASAGVQPGGPFLPTASHAGGAPAFALAIEGGDVAVNAFAQAGSLEAARGRLISEVENLARALTLIAEELAASFRIQFNGIDFSLAPFPAPTHSLGRAMEMLGLPALGLHGSLAAAAIVTEALDQARFLHAGFNGMMLPVLEDSTLAERAAQGVLTVQDLLMYAAVCGTGLDTIPLPGDTSEAQIYAVLLDVAALARRLRKPLTVRLMPVPGKQAGDAADFDFAFFAPSRVMALKAEPLTGFLAGGESFDLIQRPALA